MSRFDYVKYDDEAQGMQQLAKMDCTRLETTINKLRDGREKSVALTKLEEVYMWIGKAIRNEQIMRNGSAELQEERNNE